MNQFIIKKYIRKLTKNDIYQFALKQNIFLSEEEADILYNYIKNKNNLFFQGYHNELLEEIKPKVSALTYDKIVELYDLYKDKI